MLQFRDKCIESDKLFLYLAALHTHLEDLHEMAEIHGGVALQGVQAQTAAALGLLVHVILIDKRQEAVVTRAGIIDVFPVNEAVAGGIDIVVVEQGLQRCKTGFVRFR